MDWSGASDEDLQEISDEEDNVKTRIIFAREELKVIEELNRSSDSRISI